MFGYVRPFKSELLVREYDQYKAAYCQLCRALQKHYGRLASFTLSYDCTFYALLILSMQESKLSLHHGRCVMNPLKRCDFLESDGEAYHKAAALSVLLTYHKLRDNLEDDSFWKSFGSRVFLPFVSRKAKKAAKEYPFLAQEAQRAGRAHKAGVRQELAGDQAQERGLARAVRAHKAHAFAGFQEKGEIVQQGSVAQRQGEAANEKQRHVHSPKIQNVPAQAGTENSAAKGAEARKKQAGKILPHTPFCAQAKQAPFREKRERFTQVQK